MTVSVVEFNMAARWPSWTLSETFCGMHNPDGTGSWCTLYSSIHIGAFISDTGGHVPSGWGLKNLPTFKR